MVPPEGRAGKALALGICAVLVLLVYAAVVRPLVGAYDDLKDDLANASAQRDRLVSLEAELPALRQRVEELRNRKQADEGKYLLPAASDSVAAAALQSKVQALGRARGAEVSSVESLAPKVEDGFRRVAVRVVISCDLQALTGILSSLVTSQPVLYVENLEIRSNGGTAGAQSGTVPLLTVGMDVYGYRAEETNAAGDRG
jgi:general secretion pathway protein M